MTNQLTPTSKSKARLENAMERNREEGNWNKCIELASQLAGDQNQLQQFLLGEAKLEKYLQSNGDQTSASAVLLMDAKKHLVNCLSCGGSSQFNMDANLLLAKLHYINGDYGQSLRCIEVSGIDSVTQMEKVLPLRVMKLVTESFAVKGMALEKDRPLDRKDEVRLDCLIKASNLSLRYLQNVEKQQGPYLLVSLGPILETAIQRAPILFIESNKLEKSCNLYRSLMNACETPSTMATRQIISRQLAEVILRGVSRHSWSAFDTSITTTTGPWKPYRYFGQSLFVPKEREEEILLFLLISEMLASRNVLLDRSPEFNQSRKESLDNVVAIYDLTVILLTSYRFFVTDMFERALKFSFENKHIWFQYALSLIESKKCPHRALLVLKEVSQFDLADPLPCLLAAKLCILEISDPYEALVLAKKALERCTNDANVLLAKIYLIIGVANAMIYEEGTETIKKLKQDNLNDAIKYLKMASNKNPNDHLPYYHLALLLAHQRAISDALYQARIAFSLNPQHLPTIQLIILCLSALKYSTEALNLCEAVLDEYPDHLILLYIKAHLEEIVCENGRELALLTAKHMLRCCKLLSNEDNEKVHTTSNCLLTGTNYDTMSLKMEQTLSEVTSMDSGAGGPGDPYSGSSVNGSINTSQMWTFQLQVWILIAELYIKLGQSNEAESCIVEGASLIFGPLSHQLMYLKGVLCKAKGHLIESKKYLQNAVSINAKHAKALQQLGHIFHMLGNQLAADKYLRDSLNVDATLHETWSFMGLVLNAMGNYDRASDCHVTALQLESTSPILPFNIIPRTVLE